MEACHCQQISGSADSNADSDAYVVHVVMAEVLPHSCMATTTSHIAGGGCASQQLCAVVQSEV
jgi:hypothetical protein